MAKDGGKDQKAAERELNESLSQIANLRPKGELDTGSLSGLNQLSPKLTGTDKDSGGGEAKDGEK